MTTSFEGEPPCLVCGALDHGFMLFANGDMRCLQPAVTAPIWNLPTLPTLDAELPSPRLSYSLDAPPPSSPAVVFLHDAEVDWYGVYINGALQYESNTVDLCAILTLLNVQCTRRQMVPGWLKEQGTLPKRLEEVELVAEESLW